MIYFTKIIAQEHFVYVIFQRHEILSNQKLNIFPKSKTMAYFNNSKSFNASFNPGLVGSYKQALRASRCRPRDVMHAPH